MRSPAILGVIPARRGSKGLPRKNLRTVAGKPLIAYTIETALAVSRLFHRILVSTDDPEVAQVARALGAYVPFLRPAELAGDNVAMVPVLEHAVRFVEQQDGIRLDWVYLLQPTEPFRTAEDIAGGIEMALQGDCDSVISVSRVYAQHPVAMRKVIDNRLVPFCLAEQEGTRRQDYQPPAYMRDGSVYLTRRDVLIEQHSIWGRVARPYYTTSERLLSIDTEFDLKLMALLVYAAAARA